MLIVKIRLKKVMISFFLCLETQLDYVIFLLIELHHYKSATWITLMSIKLVFLQL
jgi:hypothetical protein